MKLTKINVFILGVGILASHAYIKLVEASNRQTITIDELKELFRYYKEITSKTGQQLGWEYGSAAFPYELKDAPEGQNNCFYLISNKPGYHAMIVSIGTEELDDTEGMPQTQYFIQITLPHGATHGDKGKANEFCKFLAKKFEGELHLFNGRVMYFYKRK
jgi:hypothetical protein